MPLHAHARDARRCRLGTTVEVDRLDILIDERDRVPFGRQRRQQGQAATGRLARLPMKGSACSMPQYETSNRGLISTMSATLSTPQFHFRGVPCAHREHARLPNERARFDPDPGPQHFAVLGASIMQDLYHRGAGVS